jgi:hypothetical protein
MKNDFCPDGTSLASESAGVGPEMVLIGTRAENALLTDHLAGQFRATSYDQ